MGIEKYVSGIKIISAPQETVYHRLSDLENLVPLFDPKRIEEIKKQNPKAPDIQLKDFRATSDECSFNMSPLGTVGIEIIEREASKLIKLTASKGVPFQVHCWVQLVEVDEKSCKIKITIHADLNPMFKMLSNKYLKEGVDQIAEALSKIAYT